MTLEIEWNQTLVLVAARLPLAVQQKIRQEIGQLVKSRKKRLVSVALVSEKEIKFLNKNYRGKDKVTDVLAFPFKDEEILGEVLICYSQAKRQAKQFGFSLHQEIVILVIHGLLHLLGFDHLEKKEAIKMFTQQKKVLQSLKIKWLPPEPG